MSKGEEEKEKKKKATAKKRKLKGAAPADEEEVTISESGAPFVQTIKCTLKKILSDVEEIRGPVLEWINRAVDDCTLAFIIGSRLALTHMTKVCSEYIATGKLPPALNSSFFGSCLLLSREKAGVLQRDIVDTYEKEFKQYLSEKAPFHSDESAILGSMSVEMATTANTFLMMNFQKLHKTWCLRTTNELLPLPKKENKKGTKKDETEEEDVEAVVPKTLKDARSKIFLFLQNCTYKGKTPNYAKLTEQLGPFCTDAIIRGLENAIELFMRYIPRPDTMLPITKPKLQKIKEMEVTTEVAQWAAATALELIPFRSFAGQKETLFRVNTRKAVVKFLNGRVTQRTTLNDLVATLRRECNGIFARKLQKNEGRRSAIYTEELESLIVAKMGEKPPSEPQVELQSSWYLLWLWYLLKDTERHNAEHPDDKKRLWTLLPVSGWDRRYIQISSTALFMYLFFHSDIEDENAFCCEWMDGTDWPERISAARKAYAGKGCLQSREIARAEFSKDISGHWDLCFNIPKRSDLVEFANTIYTDGIGASVQYHNYGTVPYRRSDALKAERVLRGEQYKQAHTDDDSDDEGQRLIGVDDNSEDEEARDDDDLLDEFEREDAAVEVRGEATTDGNNSTAQTLPKETKKLSPKERLAKFRKEAAEKKEREFMAKIGALPPGTRILAIDCGKRDVFVLVEYIVGVTPLETKKRIIRSFSGKKWLAESGATKLQRRRSVWTSLDNEQFPGYAKWFKEMPTLKTASLEGIQAHLKHLQLRIKELMIVNGRKRIREERFRNYCKQQSAMAKMVKELITNRLSTENKFTRTTRRNYRRNLLKQSILNGKPYVFPDVPPKPKLVIVMGDARFGCTGPVERLRTELIRLANRRNDVVFYNMNEYNTSQMPSCCAMKPENDQKEQADIKVVPKLRPKQKNLVLPEHQLLAKKINQKERRTAKRVEKDDKKRAEGRRVVYWRKIYAVRQCKLCQTLWNRDVNAAVNMLRIVLHQHSHGGERHHHYRPRVAPGTIVVYRGGEDDDPPDDGSGDRGAKRRRVIRLPGLVLEVENSVEISSQVARTDGTVENGAHAGGQWSVS